MSNYEIKRGDSLYNIAKNQYGLTNKTDIMNKVNEIAKANNIKNPNLIFAGDKLNLPEQLKLNSVIIHNPNEDALTTVLKDSTGNTNYYRANSVFGDIATKKDEYPDQEFKESELKKITQATTDVVEDVVVDVEAHFTSDTNRDLKAFDIAAKPAGVGGFTDMNAKGEGTDAYRAFLEVNADDFKEIETVYKGEKETNQYFDLEKSDGKITVFGSEIVDGKEYLTLRDNDGVVHYYDKENGLSEHKFNE